MKKHAQLKTYVLSGLLCLSVFATATSCFANNVIVGRYLSVAATPAADQKNLLQQQIQIKFPQNILTIKQAVKFILQFSGYRLCNENELDKPAKKMLSQPLPEVDRTFGPMTLKQGLQTLAGNMFYLLLDPIDRLVGFEIKPDYRHLYENTAINKSAEQEAD
ncbi:MAG: pili assembly chaperone [Coxiellaceae bacterium]|nr:pili assembly chaperone [Coxiellaceae bacterium]